VRWENTAFLIADILSSTSAKNDHKRFVYDKVIAIQISDTFRATLYIDKTMTKQILAKIIYVPLFMGLPYILNSRVLSRFERCINCIISVYLTSGQNVHVSIPYLVPENYYNVKHCSQSFCRVSA